MQTKGTRAVSTTSNHHGLSHRNNTEAASISTQDGDWQQGGGLGCPRLGSFPQHTAPRPLPSSERRRQHLSFTGTQMLPSHCPPSTSCNGCLHILGKKCGIDELLTRRWSHHPQLFESTSVIPCSGVGRKSTFSGVRVTMWVRHCLGTVLLKPQAHHYS